MAIQGATVHIPFYPVEQESCEFPVCEHIPVRCQLARGDYRNCTPESCILRMREEGYALRGDRFACVSCFVLYGAKHAQSCGIGGLGAQ
jgi:hypothetical protein